MTSVNKERIPSFCILALGIFGAVFFLIHSLDFDGERGFVSLDRMDVEIEDAEARLAVLVERREGLERDIDLVSDKSIDADLLGELARRQMGLYAPNEIVINMGEN